MTNRPIFLKLGGSLITNKTGVEAVRPERLARLAEEIQAARKANPDLQLLLGHGSGSFGHVVAAKHGTRNGAETLQEWYGFAEVSDAAARLNKLVVKALRDAGVPAIAFQPSASAICENGRLRHVAIHPIQSALNAGLVPVIYGDVAFDRVRGGTIISTEEIMSVLVGRLQPSRLLLAGETEGVYDQTNCLIPTITPANLDEIKAALGGSHGTDVTGGMASKVESMVALTKANPDLQILIFTGLVPDLLGKVLLGETAVGTTICT